MLRKNKLAILVAVIMIAAMALAACSTTPEPEVIIQTVEVEVEVTKIVEKEGERVIVVETQIVEVTPPPPEPTEVPVAEPQTYRMGIFEDLTSTNFWAILDPDAIAPNFYVFTNQHPALYTLAYPDILYVPQMAQNCPRYRSKKGTFGQSRPRSARASSGAMAKRSPSTT